MTLTQLQRGFAITAFLLLAGGMRGEGLLVTCANADTCDFKVVASFSVNGRVVVREVAAKTIAAVTVAALRTSRDKKIDEFAGLVRDPASGLVYSFSANGESPSMIFPGGSSPKDAAAITGLWPAAKIASRDSLKAKADQLIVSQTFAAYLTGRDLKETAVTFAKSLIAGTSPTTWKAGLLRGAIGFGGSAPSYKAWQDQLFTSSKDALARYRKQDGDPRRLSDLLSASIRDGEVLVEIAPTDQTFASLLKDAKGEQTNLKKKVAIATAFAAAGYWDESVLKIRELGLAKWSFQELAASERNALTDSAKAHKANSEKMERSGFLDRAFDEAEQAYQRNPCNAEIALYFNSIRPQFVERNKEPNPGAGAAVNRSALQQLERQLRSVALNPVQLQQESYRTAGYSLIAQGDAIDRTYVPFQLAKAQFLQSVGKLAEAFDVVVDVERRYGLDVKQRDEWLLLDANLSLTLSATRNKELDDAKSNLDAGRFAQALDATTRGLAADPTYPSLLIQRASASASLRQPDDALHAIQTLLLSSNAACAEPGAYEKAFALRDALGPAPNTLSSQSTEPADGVPNWMSGKRYAPGKLYYDPVSLAFVPRMVAVNGMKIPKVGTSFTWDGLRLVNIETKELPADGKGDSGRTTFFVDVEYAPGTLRMTGVGPRAIQDGKRVSYPLTFWNDPRVNIGLLQATGKVAARGWSGNPVFDPFIWSGIYLFDFKYDDKGRVIEAVPVPDETRGRSFSESLTFQWDDATNRLKTITSKSYQRVFKYDNKGRLVSEEATFRNVKATTSYQYAGDSFAPRRAISDSVFDKQERSAFFQSGN